MSDKVRPFPLSVDLDDDGYPCEAWIEALKAANDVLGAGKWLANTFPLIVRDIGNTFEPQVFEGKDDFDHRILVIRYSTGGWSGQEDFISALSSTCVNWLYSWSWQRGGHYEFRVPVGDLERVEEKV